ncbi:DUF3822 family protein [Polaribacter sp.]|uniref:DUF3822 family protein n=1 Tax=Polaribacter sp. TaxID=1920175 RepID=UPI003EF0FFF6
MIRKTVQKKNSNTTVKNTENTKLSIQFNLDGFSFCITEIETNNIVYFSEYTFDETLKTPENLLFKIEEIFKNDTNLQHNFSSVLVIHQNNLATFVPNTFFNEDHLAHYLNLNIKTLATDFIAFDSLKTAPIKNIYVPYININNYLFQNFGEFEYKHHLTIFVEKLLNSINSDDKTMFVNVSKSNFDLVVLQGKNVLFVNSFDFESDKDFMYHILFTAEQLKLATDNVKLYVTGKIEVEADIYKMLYKYIRNVYFLESNNPIFNHLESSKHSHYIQLGS